MISWNFFHHWWQHRLCFLLDGHLTNPTNHGYVRKALGTYSSTCFKKELGFISNLWLFNYVQNQTLEHYTSYKCSDIQLCVCALRELQHNTSNCPLNAIREKYKHQKVCNHILLFEFVPHCLSEVFSCTLVAASKTEAVPLTLAPKRRTAELNIVDLLTLCWLFCCSLIV